MHLEQIGRTGDGAIVALHRVIEAPQHVQVIAVKIEQFGVVRRRGQRGLDARERPSNIAPIENLARLAGERQGQIVAAARLLADGEMRSATAIVAAADA